MRSVVSLIFFFIILSAPAFVLGQNPNASNSLEPTRPQKEYGPKKTKKKKAPVTYDARNEFYDRMEKNWDDREKREKDLNAANLMQPPYFGHKRPPKKRPVSKMKYCKICGIRH